MTTTSTTGGLNKMVAMIAGAVLVLVGLLGFVMTPLVLGVFEISLLHNIIHLLSGAVLLGAAFMDNGANSRMALLVLGVVYALVTVLGFVATGVVESLGVAINMADNVLHLALAVVFIAVPLIAKDIVPGTTVNRV